MFGWRPASALVAMVLLSVACSGSSTRSLGISASPLSGAALNATNATGVPTLPRDRFALPSFDFAQFQSLMGQLATKGVPVIVNIWASWCGPCRVEGPNLVKAAKKYGAQVQFLGVDILDQRNAAQAFIREEGYPYPSVFDPSGEIRDRLGYLGQPVTIFFDVQGQKVDEWSGAIGLPQLIERVGKILPPAS